MEEIKNNVVAEKQPWYKDGRFVTVIVISSILFVMFLAIMGMELNNISYLNKKHKADTATIKNSSGSETYQVEYYKYIDKDKVEIHLQDGKVITVSFENVIFKTN